MKMRRSIRIEIDGDVDDVVLIWVWLVIVDPVFGGQG